MGDYWTTRIDPNWKQIMSSVYNYYKDASLFLFLPKTIELHVYCYCTIDSYRTFAQNENNF
jgi:hypothetical protein